MSGLRQKLILGFGSLLVLVLATGAVSLYLLDRYSGTVDRVFRENYRSVAYGQAMKDAVARSDDALQTAMVEGRAVDATRLVGARRDFEEALEREAGNVTVPGEGEVVAGLRERWVAYRDEVAALAAADPGAAAWRERCRARAFPLGQQVKGQAQRVIDINLGSIVSADGEIRRGAASATRTMCLLLAVGALLAAAAVALFMRSILAPLRTLTGSAREIERGNLDLVVPVASTDEVGQLAEAFNAMAGRLRETRRSERLKIVRAQRTTQLALDSLPDAIAIVAADGRVDLANPAAQRLFRLRPGVALDAVDQPGLAAIHRQVAASGLAVHPKGFDGAIQVFDGEERFFLPHALPIVDSDGQAAGTTLVLADITTLRRLDEMKSNLLAVVSHELKTPLTSLRMATHLLLDERTGPLTAKQADLALSARDDSDRLGRIVAGLLDLSRIESGHALMELAPVAPRQLVDHACEAVRAAYRDKGIELAVELPDDLPMVMADAVRMDHVFANLLGNALRFTPSGGRVALGATPQAGAVEFRVEDTGPGIAAAHRARIFERFYRVPGQAEGGAGLGLAIAKEIVQAHGGRIWLEDHPGAGSIFCFTVPLAPSDAAV